MKVVKNSENLSSISNLLDYYLKPILGLLAKPHVNNIYVNGHKHVVYEQAGEKKIAGSSCHWPSNIDLENAVRTLANALKTPISDDEPILDSFLPDGSRLNAVLSPISQEPLLSIRVFPEEMFTTDDLVDKSSMTRAMMDYLILSVTTRQNITVSGGTGSGKTTILQALMYKIPETRRLIVIEDTTEIKTPSFAISMEAPNRRNRHGEKTVTMGRLVSNTLRQTPDQTIIGEMREPEAGTAYFTLLNTGHAGVITTLHAESAINTLDRLVGLVMRAEKNMPYEVARSGFESSINVMVHAEKTTFHGRKTSELVHLVGGKPATLFWFDPDKGEHCCDKAVLAASPIWQYVYTSRLSVADLDPLLIEAYESYLSVKGLQDKS